MQNLLIAFDGIDNLFRDNNRTCSCLTSNARGAAADNRANEIAHFQFQSVNGSERTGHLREHFVHKLFLEVTQIIFIQTIDVKVAAKNLFVRMYAGHDAIGKVDFRKAVF